jgi:hypothetical protein
MESIPSYLSTLAAADKHGSPQPADATAKHAQLSRITWDSVVLVVTQHSSAKPSTDLGRVMMLTALQLSLDGDMEVLLRSIQNYRIEGAGVVPPIVVAHEVSCER